MQLWVMEQSGHVHMARQSCMVAQPCPKTPKLTDCRKYQMTIVTSACDVITIIDKAIEFVSSSE